MFNEQTMERWTYNIKGITHTHNETALHDETK